MTSLFRGPITGPKFFAIIASFFIVIIGVNLVMAYQAIRTFPGLEVANSYVASQTFDAERAAQLALGWTVLAVVHKGQLRLTITDQTDAPVRALQISGTFGRPTSTRADQAVEFAFDGVGYSAPVEAGPGNWNLRLAAVAADGTPFHQRIIVRVD